MPMSGYSSRARRGIKSKILARSAVRGRIPRQLHVAVVLTACLLGLGTIADAEPAEGPADGAVPVVTLEALPLGIRPSDLPGDARQRVEGVLARSLFAQRVEGIRYRSRESVFRFLLDHPDFATAVVRALRLGAYRLTPIADGYRGDDGRGASGVIRILHADESRRLYHLEGRYERRGLPTLEGQLLVLFEFRHETDPAGESVVVSSLTGHVRIDTPLVGVVAQAIGLLTRPFVERQVERKVQRFFRTVARVSRWAYDQPVELVAALEGHPEVPQGPTLAAFRTVLLADRLPAWVRVPFRLAPPEDPPDLGER
jgi:hypothetical protein